MWSEIPAHWDKCEIGKICAVIGGGTPSRAISAYFGGDIVWMTPTQIDKTKIKTVCSSNERITKQGLDNSAAKIIPKGAILLTTRASIGYVAIAGCKLTTNQGFKSLVCESRVHNYYLAHWLAANKTLLNTISTGTTFKEVSTRAIRKLIIPLPPIRQQHIIARKIESIFAEIDSAAQFKNHNGCNTKNLSVNFDNLKSSILTCAYTKNEWHSSELSNFLLEKSQYGANAPSVRYNTNLPRYIRITDINNDGTLDDTKKVSVQLTNENNFVLDDGDMLFARSGSVGKTFLFQQRLGRCIFASYLIRFKINSKKLDPRFLNYYTHSNTYWAWIKTEKKGAVQMNINAQQYSKLPIPVPPLNEQRVVVKKIESIFAKIDAEKQKFAKLHAQRQTYFEQLTKLRQSVLRQAFTGKLV